MFTEKNKEEMHKFTSMLHHDDKNSNYFICQYIGGTMFSKRITAPEFSSEKASEEDCYISLNGFTGYHRKIKECRQINALVFDLDYHHKTSPEHLNWIKKRTLMLIQDAVNENRLYAANIITDTGRGLQIFYIFDASISYRTKDGKGNEKAMYAYKKIRQNIEKKLEAVLAEETDVLEMDNNVYDITRIVRLPGTLNTQSGSRAKMIYVNEDYYSFSDFYTPTQKKQTPIKNKKHNKKFRSNEALNEARMIEMEKLQLIRKNNCEGFRNYMTFIYYNSAIQVYDKKEAIAKTYAFCKNFGESNTAFTESQIKAITRGIDNNKGTNFKGHYIITKEWIIEKLDITDEEAELIGLDKIINARQLKKRRNAELKKERNIRIIRMADENISRSDIAKEIGVSLRTVQSVLKNSGKTRGYTKNVNVQKNAS
ncbi:MAG: helix-turn-helix domain-containing protein [Acutalibacteraceae bacterium]|nr:helix-turn-helix domain-containing protein [Acutalibacteraceae bacterium]